MAEKRASSGIVTLCEGLRRIENNTLITSECIRELSDTSGVTTDVTADAKVSNSAAAAATATTEFDTSMTPLTTARCRLRHNG